MHVKLGVSFIKIKACQNTWHLDFFHHKIKIISINDKLKYPTISSHQILQRQLSCSPDPTMNSEIIICTFTNFRKYGLNLSYTDKNSLDFK